MPVLAFRQLGMIAMSSAWSGEAREAYGPVVRFPDPYWRWSPERGRWSPALGRPDVATRIALSTEDCPSGEAFDYWRDIACYDWAPDRPEPDAPFAASAWGLVPAQAELYAYRVSALSGTRTRAALASDGHGDLSIGLVLSGSRIAEAAGDREVHAESGGAFVHDAGRPSRLAWSEGEGVHLVLRRGMMERLFDGHIPVPSVMIAMLTQSPLFPHWRRTMLGLARLPRDLHAAQAGFVIDQAASLTQFMLRQAHPGESSLHAAAMALIEWNLAESRLSPGWIAERLGCSRASLYRAFQGKEHGIAKTIAELRYREAWRALAGNPAATISDVALSCGILDTVNFSRSFRERFGMSPSEARAAFRAR